MVLLSAPVAPAMQSTLSSLKSHQALYELQRAVRMAQALALQYQSSFTLKPVDDCVDAKSQAKVITSLRWSCGWVVFNDENHNRIQDQQEPIALARVLSDQHSSKMLSIVHKLSRPVKWSSDGTTTDWGSWSDCDESQEGGLSRWKATLSRLGRLQVQWLEQKGCAYG